MPIPVWSVGQVLSAADVNSWFVPVVTVKNADTSRNNTTSPTNDPDLKLPLKAGCTYAISGVIFYSGPSAGSSDIKFTFNPPPGNNGQYFVGHQNLSSQFAGAFQNSWLDVVTANTNGVTTIMCLAIQGINTIGSSDGNLQFQWAQNTSNATNTIVKAQSYLVAQRIG